MDPNKEKSWTRYIQRQILPTTQGRRNINIGQSIPSNRVKMNTTKLILRNQHCPDTQIRQWHTMKGNYNPICPLNAETKIFNKMLSNWVRVSKLVSSQRTKEISEIWKIGYSLKQDTECSIFNFFIFLFLSLSPFYLFIYLLFTCLFISSRTNKAHVLGFLFLV